MRIIKYIMMVGMFIPAVIFCQRPYRISFQTGFFQYHFDGTPIVNFSLAHRKLTIKTIGTIVRGYLGNSDGISFSRKIAKNSYLSMEYMVYQPYFPPKQSYTPEMIGPLCVSKYLKHININYSRKLSLNKKLKFTYGGGVNYTWGKEDIYLFTVGTPALYEPVFFILHRNDFGLNARIGLEYTPWKWLTFFTQFNFVRKIVMNARGNWPGEPHIRASDFFKTHYHRNDIPSRMYLTWRFGIGYNFK